MVIDFQLIIDVSREGHHDMPGSGCSWGLLSVTEHKHHRGDATPKSIERRGVGATQAE